VTTKSYKHKIVRFRTTSLEPLALGDLRSGIPSLLHVLERVLQLLDPLALLRPDELHAPRERLAAAPRHAGVDERVQNVALRHPEPGHRRHGGVREEPLDVADPHAPRHLAPDAVLD